MNKKRNNCLWFASRFALSAAFPAALAMLSGMMLAGCSAVDTDDIGMTEDGRVPIEFTLSGNSLSAEADDPTRAGEETSYNVSFLGWEHTTASPTNAPGWIDVINNVTGTSKVFSFDPKRYYDTSKNTSISGFYPPIVINSTTPTWPALYNTDLNEVMSDDSATGGLKVVPADGTVDIMASGIETGSASNKIGTVTMKHLTAQIVLKVMAKDGDYDNVKSKEITKIALKDAQVPTVVSPQGAIKNFEPKDITVFSGTKNIPQEAEDIGTAAFLNPGTSLPLIGLSTATYTFITSIDGITSLEAGKKYIITITISNEGLEPPTVEVVSPIDGGRDDEVPWEDNGDYTITL